MVDDYGADEDEDVVVEAQLIKVRRNQKMLPGLFMVKSLGHKVFAIAYWILIEIRKLRMKRRVHEVPGSH